MQPFDIGPHTIPGPFIMAPMSGISSAVDREIARAHGAHASPTELVSSKGLLHNSERTRGYLAKTDDEDPFWVQLFGGEVEAMAEATKIVADHGAQIVDINMGCPVKKVTKSGAGVALMADPDRAVRMVEAMRRATDDRVPITTKFRAGFDKDTVTAIEFGVRMAEAGAACLILHPRVKAQHHSGAADWSLLKRLKEAVDVPVIGSGGVRTPEDGYRMLEETGVDGAMVGRAALGNPWIFAGLLRRADYAPSPDERADVVLDHFRRFASLIGHEEAAIRKFRTRALYYARGLSDCTVYRQRVVRIRDRAELEATLDTFFRAADRVPGYIPGHGWRPGDS